MRAPLLLAIGAIGLAGCSMTKTAGTAVPNGSLDSLVPGNPPSFSSSGGSSGRLAGDRAAVRLPAWVGSQKVASWRTDDGKAAQTIRVAARDGDGEDFVNLNAWAPGTAAPSDRPTEKSINAELTALFPGTPMQVVARPARNGAGPYGLAVGRRDDGARCLYAWQWVEGGIPAARGEPTSLRVRLCRTNTSLDAMAGAVDHMNFGAGTLAEKPARSRVASHRPQRSPRTDSSLAAAETTFPAPAASYNPTPAPAMMRPDASMVRPDMSRTDVPRTDTQRTDLPLEATQGPRRNAAPASLSRL